MAANNSNSSSASVSQTGDAIVTDLTAIIQGDLDKLKADATRYETAVTKAEQTTAQTQKVLDAQMTNVAVGTQLKKADNAHSTEIHIADLTRDMQLAQRRDKRLAEQDLKLSMEDEREARANDRLTEIRNNRQGLKANGEKGNIFERIIWGLGDSVLANEELSAQTSLTTSAQRRAQTVQDSATIRSTAQKQMDDKGAEELRIELEGQELQTKIADYQADVAGNTQLRSYLKDQAHLDTQGRTRIEGIIKNSKDFAHTHLAAIQVNIAQEQLRMQAGQYQRRKDLENAVEKQLIKFNKENDTQIETAVEKVALANAIESGDYSGLSATLGGITQNVITFTARNMSIEETLKEQPLTEVANLVRAAGATSDPMLQQAKKELTRFGSVYATQFEDATIKQLNSMGVDPSTATRDQKEQARQKGTTQVLTDLDADKEGTLAEQSFKSGIVVSETDLMLDGAGEKFAGFVAGLFPDSLQLGKSTTSDHFGKYMDDALTSLHMRKQLGKASDEDVDRSLKLMANNFRKHRDRTVQTDFPVFSASTTPEKVKLLVPIEGLQELTGSGQVDITNYLELKRAYLANSQRLSVQAKGMAFQSIYEIGGGK